MAFPSILAIAAGVVKGQLRRTSERTTFTRAQNRPPIRGLLVGSVSGDNVEPAIYATKIENCRDCWEMVYLDRPIWCITAPIPSRAGSIRQPALDRRVNLCTTPTVK
jgi:hypothetical protein